MIGYLVYKSKINVKYSRFNKSKIAIFVILGHFDFNSRSQLFGFRISILYSSFNC